MKEKPILQQHHGVDVWVNPITEALRKEECLCFNCNKLKPGESDNCPKAKKLYKIAVEENVAMMVTRCSTWGPNKK